MDEIRIVGFAGSLRRGSFNRGVIRAAAESAPSGIRVEVFELTDIPLYNQDVEDAGEPASVVALKRAIAGADGLLVATPEYNHGVPGMLKNALDWASRPRATSPLRDKPIAVTGASTGTSSTARAQAQLRELLRPRGRRCRPPRGSGWSGCAPTRPGSSRWAPIRATFVFTGACVMPQPELLIGAAASRFDEGGNLTDAEVRRSLVQLIEALRAWTVRLRLKEVA